LSQLSKRSGIGRFCKLNDGYLNIHFMPCFQ
jgi:hypothetical protein